MGTRSKLIAFGTTGGTGPVPIWTCPADTTAIVKYVAGNCPSLAPAVLQFAAAYHQPAGGPISPFATLQCEDLGIPVFFVINAPWEVFEPEDVLLIGDDGLGNWNLTVSGALLEGVAL